MTKVLAIRIEVGHLNLENLDSGDLNVPLVPHIKVENFIRLHTFRLIPFDLILRPVFSV